MWCIASFLLLSDHDVTIFTKFEMLMSLEYLMDNLDNTGRDTYIDLYNQFPTLSKDDINQTVTTWPPSLHLIMKVSQQYEHLSFQYTITINHVNVILFYSCYL